jgi:hypothetical protein
MRDITAKVQALNNCNELINFWKPKLIEIFEPYLGQKVVKIDGQVLSKIKLPEFPCNPKTHIWRYLSEYSLAWQAQASFYDGHYNCIHHSVFYIGNLSDQVLTELHKNDKPLRTNYTVEEFKNAYEHFRSCETALNNARSAIFPLELKDFMYG